MALALRPADRLANYDNWMNFAADLLQVQQRLTNASSYGCAREVGTGVCSREGIEPEWRLAMTRDEVTRKILAARPSAPRNCWISAKRKHLCCRRSPIAAHCRPR